MKLAQPRSYLDKTDEQLRDHYDKDEIAVPADVTYGGAVDFVRTFVLKMDILANYQNGRDTHLRGVRIWGPPPAALENPMLYLQVPVRPRMGRQSLLGVELERRKSQAAADGEDSDRDNDVKKYVGAANAAGTEFGSRMEGVVDGSEVKVDLHDLKDECTAVDRYLKSAFAMPLR